MYAVDKDIEVSAQFAICIKQMEFNRGILLNDSVNDFTDRRARDREFTLVIDVIFHHSRETNDWHESILLNFKRKDTLLSMIFSNQLHSHSIFDMLCIDNTTVFIEET
jgi:hypothetical protein